MVLNADFESVRSARCKQLEGNARLGEQFFSHAMVLSSDENPSEPFLEDREARSFFRQLVAKSCRKNNHRAARLLHVRSNILLLIPANDDNLSFGIKDRGRTIRTVYDQSVGRFQERSCDRGKFLRRSEKVSAQLCQGEVPGNQHHQRHGGSRHPKYALSSGLRKSHIRQAGHADREDRSSGIGPGAEVKLRRVRKVFGYFLGKGIEDGWQSRTHQGEEASQRDRGHKRVPKPAQLDTVPDPIPIQGNRHGRGGIERSNIVR
jgi:hypothetical protein